MGESLYALISGLGIGLSFILGIGAQNAFVLKQGLNRQHVFAVCLTCALSDTLLIIAGVIAHQEFSVFFPKVKIWFQYLGGGFLIFYGIKSFYNVWFVTHSLQDYFSTPTEGESRDKRKSLISHILITLAFTWLNPHVYLDTFIVIGSLSLKFPEAVGSYVIGAVSASYLFFFSLGYGARVLTPWFQKPQAWKVLDGVIGVVMLGLGWSLIQGSL